MMEHIYTAEDKQSKWLFVSWSIRVGNREYIKHGYFVECEKPFANIVRFINPPNNIIWIVL